MKPRIMITFNEGSEGSGPYVSHQRICESSLRDKYDFFPLVIPKGRRGWFNVKLVLNLYRQIKKCSPDLVHITGLQLDGFYTTVAALLAKKKRVLVVRGSSTEAIVISRLKKWLLKRLEIYTLRRCDVVYGVSSYVCDLPLVKRNARRLFGCVYNMRPQTETAGVKLDRRDFNIEEEDVVVASTGRITREKGFETLKEAILRIKAKNVKFLIVGTGDYLEEFQKEIEKENKKNVIFLGYRNDVPKILELSDIFVLCTLHETLSNSIIEAGALGLPVVASKVGGIPEVVDDNNGGFLIEKYDVDEFVNKLNLLINNKDLRVRFGNYNRVSVENKFSEKNIVDRLDLLYQSVLNDGR